MIEPKPEFFMSKRNHPKFGLKIYNILDQKIIRKPDCPNIQIPLSKCPTSSEPELVINSDNLEAKFQQTRPKLKFEHNRLSK